LLSCSSRPGSYGSAQGTQMDAQEAVTQFKGAQQLGQSVGGAAQAQGALGLTSHDADPKQALQGLIESIDPKHQGQHASEKKANGREPGDPVETFAKPYVVLDTPSAAILASPATIASFSGQDTSLTAQGDVHAAAAHTASLVSGQTTSLYTHQGELQAIAANGDLSLRAHTDQLEMLADSTLSIVCVNGEITVTAKRIEMVGGDSKMVLNEADIDFITPGTFITKAAAHEWGGPASGSASVPVLPSGAAPRLPELSDKPTLEKPVFSEALGFTEFPSAWLPFASAKQAIAFEDQRELGRLLAGTGEDFTMSLLTQQPKEVRYALSVNHGWSIEQGIEVASDDADSTDAKGEEGND